MSNTDGSTITSILTGNKPFQISQIFGEKIPGLEYMYGYAKDVGLEPGQHPGIDIATPMGTDIYAPHAGTVEQVGFAPYFRPKPVYVRRLDGGVDIFGHLWDDGNLQVGQKVKPGDYIGKSGRQTTGENFETDGTGPHIHFEMRDANNKALNPYEYLVKGGDVQAGTKPSNSIGSSKFLERVTISLLGFTLLTLGVVALVLPFTPQGRVLRKVEN